jgi:small subunit ribosomal protein S9
MSKAIHTSGKRKRAVARATLKEGNGKIRVNKVPIENIRPEIYKLRLQEPLILSGNLAEKVDIDINVYGGGIKSQTDASRLALSKALADYSKSEKLRKQFLEYDRSLLVGDVRRKETHKPNRHGKARAKRQKSYR